jgi:hypothetical protein
MVVSSAGLETALASSEAIVQENYRPILSSERGAQHKKTHNCQAEKKNQAISSR